MSKARPSLTVTVAGFLAAGGSLPGLARAAPTAAGGERLQLTWQAPAGCPAPAQVKAEVMRLVGPSRVGPPGELTATATVQRVDNTRWAVQLTTALAGTQGKRRVEGDSCQAVASATALILALTMDPEATAKGPAAGSVAGPAGAPPPRLPPRTAVAKVPGGGAAASRTSPAPATTSPPTSASALPVPAPVPAPESPTSVPVAPIAVPSPPAPVDDAVPAAGRPADPPAPTAAVPPAPETSPALATAAAVVEDRTGPSAAFSAPASFRPFLRPFFGITSASLPTVAGIAGAGVGFHWGDFEASAAGWASQRRRQLVDDRPGAGGDFRLLGAQARLCGQLAQGWVRLGLCGGAALERVTADGFGVESPGGGAALLGAGLLAGTLAVPVAARIDATFEITGLARPYRPRFVLQGLGPVFSVPATATLATLGVMVKL